MTESNNSNNKKSKTTRSSKWTAVGIIVVGLLGGIILLAIAGSIPAILGKFPEFFGSLFPNLKVSVTYLYIAIIFFLAGRSSKK